MFFINNVLLIRNIYAKVKRFYRTNEKDFVKRKTSGLKTKHYYFNEFYVH